MAVTKVLVWDGVVPDLADEATLPTFWRNSAQVKEGAEKPPTDYERPPVLAPLSDVSGEGVVVALQVAQATIQSMTTYFAPIQEWAKIEVSIRNIDRAGGLVLQIHDRNGLLVYAEGLTQKQVWGLPSFTLDMPPLAQRASDDEPLAKQRAKLHWARLDRAPYRARVLILAAPVTTANQASAFACLKMPVGATAKGVNVSSTRELGSSRRARADETAIRVDSLKLGLGEELPRKARRLLDEHVAAQAGGPPGGHPEPEITDAKIVEWVRVRLNELGYHAGPAGQTADLEKAIARFRATHPNLYKTPYTQFDGPYEDLRDQADWLFALDAHGREALALLVALHDHTRGKVSVDKQGSVDAARDAMRSHVEGLIDEALARRKVTASLVTALREDPPKNKLSVIDEPRVFEFSFNRAKVFVDLLRFYVGEKTEFGPEEIKKELERDRKKDHEHWSGERKYVVEQDWISRPVVPVAATVMLAAATTGPQPALHPEIVAGLGISWSWSDEESSFDSDLPLFSSSRPSRTANYIKMARAAVQKTGRYGINSPVEVGGIITGVDTIDATSPFVAAHASFDLRPQPDGALTTTVRDGDIDDEMRPARHGHSTLLFSPSAIAGDRYALKAELHLPSDYGFDKPRPAQTGRLVVWRRVRVAATVTWGDRQKKTLPWDEVRRAFARAHVEIVPPDASYAIDDLALSSDFNAITQRIYKHNRLPYSRDSFHPSAGELDVAGTTSSDEPWEIINVMIREVTRAPIEQWLAKKDNPYDKPLIALSAMIAQWEADAGWVKDVGAHFKAQLANVGAVVGPKWRFRPAPGAFTLARYTPGGNAPPTSRKAIVEGLLVNGSIRAALAKLIAGTLRTTAADKVYYLAYAQRMLLLGRGMLSDNLRDGDDKNQLSGATEGVNSGTTAPVVRTRAALAKSGLDLTAVNGHLDELEQHLRDAADQVQHEAQPYTYITGRRDRDLYPKIDEILGDIDTLAAPQKLADEQEVFRQLGTFVNVFPEAIKPDDGEEQRKDKQDKAKTSHPLVIEVVGSVKTKLAKLGGERKLDSDPDSEAFWQVREGWELTIPLKTKVPANQPLPTATGAGPGNFALFTALDGHYDTVEKKTIAGIKDTIRCRGLKPTTNIDAVRQLVSGYAKINPAGPDASQNKRFFSEPTFASTDRPDLDAVLTPPATEEALHRQYREAALKQRKLAIMERLMEYLPRMSDPIAPLLDDKVRKKLIAANQRPDGLVVVDFVVHPPIAIDGKEFYIAPASLGKTNGVTLIARGMPLAPYHLIAHEMSHCMFFKHWERGGTPGVRRGFSVQLDHDQGDQNCIMSYPVIDDVESFSSRSHYHPDNYRPEFCGKCNLKQRGWNTRARSGGEYLLPGSSTGYVDLIAAQPVPKYKEIDDTAHPAEVPSPQLISEAYTDMMRGMLGIDLGTARGKWGRDLTAVGTVQVLANPEVTEEGAPKVRFRKIRTVAQPGATALPFDANPMTPQEWWEQVHAFFTLGGLNRGAFRGADQGIDLMATYHYATSADLLHEAVHFAQAWSTEMTMYEGVTDLLAGVLSRRLRRDARTSAFPRLFTYRWNPSYAELVMHVIDQWLSRMTFTALMQQFVDGTDTLSAIYADASAGATIATKLLDHGGAWDLATAAASPFATAIPSWSATAIFDRGTFRPDLENMLSAVHAADADLGDDLRAAMTDFFKFLDDEHAFLTPARQSRLPPAGTARYYKLARYARVTRKHVTYAARIKQLEEFQSLNLDPPMMKEKHREWSEALEKVAGDDGLREKKLLDHPYREDGYFSSPQFDPRV